MEGTGHRVELLDLGQTERLPAWLKEVAAEFGPLEGLVHCAGTQLIRPLRLLTEAEVEGLMSVNFTAALMLAKAFRQREVRAPSGSSVVFVSSVMGMVGAAGRSVYCASKGALDSLARALALECAREGIRVNCVAPGYVKTEMLRQAEATLAEEHLARIQEQHPLGFGEPRDVAHAIAFLLADTGRWITGSTLVVDGGYTAQ
jgi:NAD(P)-dependent dehydrogenase (short-subunit alcohol dehydrogenase family)